VTKNLGTNLKRLKVLLCFDYQNDIIDEEKDLMFASEPKLFLIGIISLPLIFLEIVVINIIEHEKTTKIIDSIVELSCKLKCSVETTFDKKLEVSLKDKVYPISPHIRSNAH
jgi:hypothetical protein